jgi:hypothetical protein
LSLQLFPSFSPRSSLEVFGVSEPRNGDSHDDNDRTEQDAGAGRHGVAGPYSVTSLYFDSPVIMTDLFLPKGRFDDDNRYIDRQLGRHLHAQKFSVMDLNDFKALFKRTQKELSEIIPLEMSTQICVMIRPQGRYSNLKRLLPPLVKDLKAAKPVTSKPKYTSEVGVHHEK